MLRTSGRNKQRLRHQYVYRKNRRPHLLAVERTYCPTLQWFLCYYMQGGLSFT